MNSTSDMSTPVLVEPEEKKYDGVGRCKCSFWFAVAHDVIGVPIILLGAFGGFVIHDLLIYGGAIIIFLSLIWWVFWYTGNIEVPPEELEDDVGLKKNHGISQIVRRMSERLSNGIRNSFRRNGQSFREAPPGNNRPSITGTNMSLSTIYDTTIASSSTELVREPLSV